MGPQTRTDTARRLPGGAGPRTCGCGRCARRGPRGGEGVRVAEAVAPPSWALSEADPEPWERPRETGGTWSLHPPEAGGAVGLQGWVGGAATRCAASRKSLRRVHRPRPGASRRGALPVGGWSARKLPREKGPRQGRAGGTGQGQSRESAVFVPSGVLAAPAKPPGGHRRVEPGCAAHTDPVKLPGCPQHKTRGDENGTFTDGHPASALP